jgi:hypothetical protein
VETGEAFNHRFNAWSVKKKERPAWDPVCLPESAMEVTKLYVLSLVDEADESYMYIP